MHNHQRAQGMLSITVARSEDRTRLSDLRQQGGLRAGFPRADGAAVHAVLLNTSGGITDGDQLETVLQAGAGSMLVAATQAAERVYRAREGAAPARVLQTNETQVATKAELENFLAHLLRECDRSGFLKNPQKRPGMIRNIRHFFQRGEVTVQELNTLHGIVTELSREIVAE